MHRYYVTVLGSLLHHRDEYAMYVIRRPFPPYATHYAALLVLSQVFSYDMAEKLLVCILLTVLAFGQRLAVREAGPNGVWVVLLIAPLLLAWPLMMGFFNFTLGVGLAILALGLWQQLSRRGVRILPVFCLVLALLTFTHPIPLLLLLCLCLLDLAVSVSLRGRPAQPLKLWAQARRSQFVALLCIFVATIVPLRVVDPSKVQASADHFGLHIPFIRTELLLTGLSPYNTRAASLSINFERLCFYAIFLFCFTLGAREFYRAVRRRTADFSNTMFLATCLLLAALPFLPNVVNGSDFFATRLLFPLWLAAILSASGAPAPSFKGRVLYVTGGILCLVATLLPAQIYMRWTAYQMRNIEHASLPPRRPGMLLQGNQMGRYVRFTYQLAYNPWEWAGVLPFVRNHDVALDSPWIDQTITPLAARPGSPLMVSDIALTATTPGADPITPMHSLPGAWETRMVRNSNFIIYTGTPEQLSQGLSEELTSPEAAEYVCRPPAGLYLICVKRTP